jgi:hypothetical protein
MKGMRKYKRSQGKPKWNALKGCNVKIQAQATKDGGGAGKEETQKPRELLEGKPDKLENAFDV